MPELPEVETVRRGIARACEGKHLSSVQVYHPRTSRYQNGPLNVAGAKVIATRRRGKFLWLELCPSPSSQTSQGGQAGVDMALVVHLGMSGQLLVATQQAPPHESRHLRAQINLSDGSRILFIDQRIFGHLETRPLLTTEQGDTLPAGMEHIARDLLDPFLDATALTARCQKRHVPMKSLLLAQDTVSGIGNIYADEALFAAQIHPLQRSHTVSTRRFSHLWELGQQILLSSLALGGTSFDSLYVDAHGNAGQNTSRLAVYGRAGQPCWRCERPLRSCRVSGRNTTFCSYCQRLPQKSNR